MLNIKTVVCPIALLLWVAGSLDNYVLDGGGGFALGVLLYYIIIFPAMCASRVYCRLYGKYGLHGKGSLVPLVPLWLWVCIYLSFYCLLLFLICNDVIMF